MKKLLITLCAIVGVCNCSALHANAIVGSIPFLLLGTVAGSESLFNFVILGLIIFIVGVIVDCLIIKRHVTWRNSVIVGSIGCNLFTMIIGGPIFVMGELAMGFGLKYESFLKLVIVGYIMTSITCGIVTAIDLAIQYLMWKKLFSIKQTDTLMIWFASSGFVLLLGIVTSKIFLRW